MGNDIDSRWVLGDRLGTRPGAPARGGAVLWCGRWSPNSAGHLRPGGGPLALGVFSSPPFGGCPGAPLPRASLCLAPARGDGL